MISIFIIILLLSLVSYSIPRKRVKTGKPYIYTGNTFAKEHGWKPTYQSVCDTYQAKSAQEVHYNALKELRKRYKQSLRDRKC